MEGDLFEFVKESNKIEGMLEVQEHELDIHRWFLALETVTITDLEKFVWIIQPNKGILRAKLGMNVRVGIHVAPPGGPNIFEELATLLLDLKYNSPFKNHMQYETLHPFMDGNGRSGRVLWAWQMQKEGYDFSLGFLHMWYYQTLNERADA